MQDFLRFRDVDPRVIDFDDRPGTRHCGGTGAVCRHCWLEQLERSRRAVAHPVWQMFGPGARFTVLPSRQLAPYLVAGGGGAWLHTVSLSNGISLTQGGYYLSVGGGANIYLGRNWGIRPEVRYSWQGFHRAETIGYSARSEE